MAKAFTGLLPFNKPSSQVEAKPVDPNVRAVDVPRLTGQNGQVLNMLRAGPVTCMDAIPLGILRLGARVHDLKALGYKITTTWKGSVAEYRLEDGQ